MNVDLIFINAVIFHFLLQKEVSTPGCGLTDLLLQPYIWSDPSHCNYH